MTIVLKWFWSSGETSRLNERKRKSSLSANLYLFFFCELFFFERARASAEHESDREDPPPTVLARSYPPRLIFCLRSRRTQDKISQFGVSKTTCARRDKKKHIIFFFCHTKYLHEFAFKIFCIFNICLILSRRAQVFFETPNWLGATQKHPTASAYVVFALMTPSL